MFLRKNVSNIETRREPRLQLSHAHDRSTLQDRLSSPFFGGLHPTADYPSAIDPRPFLRAGKGILVRLLVVLIICGPAIPAPSQPANLYIGIVFIYFR